MKGEDILSKFSCSEQQIYDHAYNTDTDSKQQPIASLIIMGLRKLYVHV